MRANSVPATQLFESNRLFESSAEGVLVVPVSPARGSAFSMIWAMVRRRIDRQQSESGCLFCRRDDTNANQILQENKTFYARYDNYPAAKGHVELVPKRHVESYFSLRMREVKDAYRLIREVESKLAEELNADGYTIGVNEGRAAGRTVDHLHIHLIPRKKGDVEDPRGGVRCVLPTRHPDEWCADTSSDALTQVGR